MLCGKPIAWSLADHGDTRPMIDRKNGWMTSASVNFLNLHAYLLRDDQYFFVQKCNLVAYAETKISNKAPQAYKCVSAKFKGLDQPRLLWLDQPIATELAKRKTIANRFVSDILESQQLQLISSEPKKAKEQVDDLIGDIAQLEDGDEDETDGHADKEDEHEASEDEDEEDRHASQTTTHYESPRKSDDDLEQGDEDEDDEEDRHEQQANAIDTEFDDIREEMVTLREMNAALAEKNSKISRLETNVESLSCDNRKLSEDKTQLELKMQTANAEFERVKKELSASERTLRQSKAASEQNQVATCARCKSSHEEIQETLLAAMQRCDELFRSRK